MINRITPLLLLFGLVLQSFLLGYCKGDINQDNLINVMDVILVINVILNNQYEQLADINSDYIVNVIDIILLVNFILQE